VGSTHRMAAPEPLSPHAILVKQGKMLPAEFWDAF
jgi:hypothetical protein